jgi:hypothetical protein
VIRGQETSHRSPGFPVSPEERWDATLNRTIFRITLQSSLKTFPYGVDTGLFALSKTKLTQKHTRPNYRGGGVAIFYDSPFVIIFKNIYFDYSTLPSLYGH